jgi:D-glycero-alpha-D-manno-heptose-7-phosphate kinase
MVAMIITRTPLRISFCGGGSDLPAFYRHEDGAVIGMAINTYVYVSLKDRFEGGVLAHYRATEDVKCAADLKHSRMRACLARAGVVSDVEVASLADVPGSTGLGSSSAFTVGLLHALWPHNHQVAHAKAACDVEIGELNTPIGKQDQYLTALGGLRFLQFHADESVEIDRVSAPPDFSAHLLLLATPYTRDADAVLAGQAQAMGDAARREQVRAMVRLAYSFRECLEATQLRDCGAVLDEAWQRKRTLASGITSDAIDRWYARAKEAGAWGGKLCGAGGGGFILAMAPPERHRAIADATGLRALPVALDSEGTQVIYGR